MSARSRMERTAEINAADEGGTPDAESPQPSADPDVGTHVSEYAMTSWFPVYDHRLVLPTNFSEDYEGTLSVATESKPLWKPQSVLQWVESLAAVAETKGGDPIVVNGVRLSDPSFPPVVSPFPERPRSTVLTMYGTRSKYMDFDGLHNRDPDGWLSLQQIESLISQTEESQVLIGCCRPIQIRFCETFHRILDQSKSVDTREALDVLYHDTILKLQEQLDSVKKDKDCLLQDTAKKDFTEVMTNWLLNNWINPYPDDQGIAELAVETETTPTVVGNWLINARTRKWRPAILKASKHLERPSTLLLEDSINIFRGEPLRKLAEESSNMSTMNQYGDYDRIRNLHMKIDQTFDPPTKRFKPST